MVLNDVLQCPRQPRDESCSVNMTKVAVEVAVEKAACSKVMAVRTAVEMVVRVAVEKLANLATKMDANLVANLACQMATNL